MFRQFEFLLESFGFEMFGRSMSHLGMSFHDLGLTTLFLNNYIDLKAQEILKMLDLFGLKITIPMKIRLI